MASRDGELNLKTSMVHRKLDAKFKVGGIEATDLLAVLILAALMNLIFGRLSIGPIFVFVLPGALFAALYAAKRDKPDGFLAHLIKFYLSPGELHAGGERTDH
jgi:hypothetical protein